MKILKGTIMWQKVFAEDFIIDEDITTRLAEISDETDF